MAILDIFNEVTEKNIVKSESGDPRIFGVLVGEVTENYSMEMPGRVCVSIHVRDSEQNVLKWARVAMPSSGSEWGHYFLPEVGDQVLVVFDQGIIDKPYVIGCIPKDKDKFLKKTKNENNLYKKIQTKHGSNITFVDGPVGGGGDDGESDKILIETANSSHQVTLDNAKKQIVISDSDKNARIEMSTETGKITVTAANKIELKAGTMCSITLNGDSGAMTITANDVSIKSNGKMVLSGTAKAELSGAMVTVSSQGSTKISSAGFLTLTGLPMKFGG